jgi:hypothetical protein
MKINSIDFEIKFTLKKNYDLKEKIWYIKIMHRNNMKFEKEKDRCNLVFFQ